MVLAISVDHASSDLVNRQLYAAEGQLPPGTGQGYAAERQPPPGTGQGYAAEGQPPPGTGQGYAGDTGMSHK